MLYLTLDIARGAAALGVFLFHFQGLVAHPFPVLAEIAQYGHLGVPLFFVISGYCMMASATSVLRKDASALSFLKRRFLRIYPPFWASVLLIAALPYLIESISSLKTGQFFMPNPAWHQFDLGDWLKTLSLTQIFFATELDEAFNSINIVYWTLAVEFQFYLVMYAALIFRKRFIAVIVAVTLLGLLYLAWVENKMIGLFLAFWHLFAIGILLYILIHKGFTLKRFAGRHDMKLAASVVAGALAAFVILALADSWNPAKAAIFSRSGFALWSAVILWACVSLEPALAKAEKRGNFMLRGSIKAAAFLGVISYSLYLLHTKLPQLPEMALRQWFAPDTAAYVLMTFLSTILLSAIFYYYCERPFISTKQRSINRLVMHGSERS